MAEQALRSTTAVLASQLRYHVRRVLRSPRALSTGALLPVLLLVVANPDRDGTARVAGLAVLGCGMTAWTNHGIGLVAARESGELRRWRAMPVPRWCLLGARVTASVLAAALGGIVTVVVGVVGYHVPADPLSMIAAVAVLVLGSAAWAAAATAVTRWATTVDTAWPVLGLTYLPVVVTSGALTDAAQPAWLRDVTAPLPARPMVHALRAALGAGSLGVTDVVTMLAWTVGGLAAAVVLFRWDPTPPHAPGSRGTA